LVKTHLIYAVRDEIEHLRSRIVELESIVILFKINYIFYFLKVNYLEAENKTLREHIPKEILSNICLDFIK
jgi:hypothetical protein